MILRSKSNYWQVFEKLAQEYNGKSREGLQITHNQSMIYATTLRIMKSKSRVLLFTHSSFISFDQFTFVHLLH